MGYNGGNTANADVISNTISLGGHSRSQSGAAPQFAGRKSCSLGQNIRFQCFSAPQKQRLQDNRPSPGRPLTPIDFGRERTFEVSTHSKSSWPPYSAEGPFCAFIFLAMCFFKHARSRPKREVPTGCIARSTWTARLNAGVEAVGLRSLQMNCKCSVARHSPCPGPSLLLALHQSSLSSLGGWPSAERLPTPRGSSRAASRLWRLIIPAF